MDNKGPHVWNLKLHGARKQYIINRIKKNKERYMSRAWALEPSEANK